MIQPFKQIKSAHFSPIGRGPKFKISFTNFTSFVSRQTERRRCGGQSSAGFLEIAQPKNKYSKGDLFTVLLGPLI